MTHTLFINTQAFGDCILGINAARRYKEEHPDHIVSYCLTQQFNLTTNDGPGGVGEVLEVLQGQSWLDSVGVATFSPQGQIQGVKLNREEPEFKSIDNVIMHYRWFSDLGISKSANFEVREHISEHTLQEGDIVLETPSEKVDDEVIRVGIAGPLDWNRKLQSENLRIDILQLIKSELESLHRPYEINLFGVEVANYTLAQSIQLLNRQDLFIAPIGSLIHASAALDVDTITFGSVFPVEYDCPEHYMSRGWHKSISAKPENHCGSYNCVVPKNSTTADIDRSPGNPKAEFGFWPRNCPFTESKLSCTKSYSLDQFEAQFKEWINVKYK